MVKLEVVRGSLVDQPVQAIVNAANTLMRGGGGIDGRIHQLAGPAMLRELQRVAPRGAAVAEIVVTPGFDLPQDFVIHVAGPIWRGGNEQEDENLALCYRRSFLAAQDLGLTSIGYCSISTGSYGFPLERAAQIAVATLRDELTTTTTIERIVLAMYGREEYEVFANEIDRQSPSGP